MNLTSKQKGDITEMECQLAFAKVGVETLKPFGDKEHYDFVAEIGNRFYKIQSKTSRKVGDGDAFIFSSKRISKDSGKQIETKYSPSDVDYFSTSYNGKCYLVPVKECGTAKTLRLVKPDCNSASSCICASDYELEKVVDRLLKL